MARIDLPETAYQPIPEGKYLFEIEEIVYNEVGNRVETRLKTESGRVMLYNYHFLTKDGKPNDIQLQMFARMAKAALNDNNAKSVDPDKLKGLSFYAEIKHSVVPSLDHPGETKTFVNLKNYEPAKQDKPAISDDELAAFLG